MLANAEELFGVLDERDALEVKLKNTNKAFHRGIREQIASIDEQIEGFCEELGIDAPK